MSLINFHQDFPQMEEMQVPPWNLAAHQPPVNPTIREQPKERSGLRGFYCF